IIVAVGLVLFVSRRTAQKPQPTMTAADATDSLATERITRDHGAVELTNGPVNVSPPKENEHKPAAEAEMTAKIRQGLEAQNQQLELWGKVVDQSDTPLSGVK